MIALLDHVSRDNREYERFEELSIGHEAQVAALRIAVRVLGTPRSQQHDICETIDCLVKSRGWYSEMNTTSLTVDNWESPRGLWVDSGHLQGDTPDDYDYTFGTRI